MELTQRAKDIILLLAEQPVGYPITLGILSEQLKLSRRTVQRVLPEIRSYLQEHGYHLEARAGSGLYLDEPDDVRQELLRTLRGTAGQHISLRGQLLGILLEQEQVWKIDALCQQLACSRDTVEKELPSVRGWLERYQIKLCSQSGVGIYLQYTEECFRTAMIEYLVEFYDSAIMSRLSDPQSETAVPLPALLTTQQNIPPLLYILKQAQQWQAEQLTDEGFLRVFLCAALVIQRVRQSRMLQMQRHKLAALRLLSEYAAAEYVTDALQQHFSITLPEDETAFLAMYWANSAVVSTETEVFLPDRMNLIYLTQQLILAVEQELGVDLQNDDALLHGLCSHLQAACSRLTLETPTEHPLLEEIRTSYPELFAAVHKACEVLQYALHISAVSDSETAYIVMHFGAALEKLHAQRQSICAVVICPTDAGSASRLAAELHRTYPQIIVRRRMSAVQIDVKQLKADGIDLIVSTIDLNIPFQVIHVNPILTERDHVLLEAVVDMLLQKKERQQASLPEPQTSWETVQFISRFGTELLQLTEDIPWQQLPLLQNWSELSHYAAYMMTADEIAANDIEMQLSTLKQPSEVCIRPFRCTLLQCRTEHIPHCRMGYLHFKTPYQHGENRIEGSLVMLLPADDETQACGTLMNKVSTLLLKNEAYLRLLREGNKVEFERLLRNELLKSYPYLIEQKMT